jgi:hypothetical protein
MLKMITLPRQARARHTEDSNCADRFFSGGRAGPPGGAPICIEPRSLGLADGEMGYVNGEFGGRVYGNGGATRDHVDVSTGTPPLSAAGSMRAAHLLSRARVLLLYCITGLLHAASACVVGWSGAGVRDISESTSVTMATWIEATLGGDKDVWMMMIDM